LPGNHRDIYNTFKKQLNGVVVDTGRQPEIIPLEPDLVNASEGNNFSTSAVPEVFRFPAGSKKGAIMFNFKRTILAAGLLFLAAPLFGLTLTGVISDSETLQSVPGAMVKVVGYDIASISDEEGAFKLSDLPTETGELVIARIGYGVKKIRFDTQKQSRLNIAVTPKILKGQDVIVTATRAQKGETPAAFSNMNSEDIQLAYWAQDIPMLLTSLPNTFAYSDAGNGIGYSYLKIRGFNQQRIAVMLNGVPLNDAESHEVFWIDLPDFASNLQDIQVQRGIGVSLYGASAMGGSVNLVTNDFSAVPSLKFETGYGSYESKKLSIAGNSGLINDSYVFYGRYSRIETDGYRDQSWSKMFSYFFGIARYDENMTWKFNTYGGPEESHLAYKGVTIEQLANDRKYNELQYDGETDHFNQPHYELLHNWKINSKLSLDNTLYYFHGEGYYTQQRSRKDIEEYFSEIYSIQVADTMLAPRDYYDLDDDGYFVLDADGLYTLEKVDLIRQPWVKEYDWGWLPRLTWKRDRGELSLGGEMRIHAGDHFGEVIWASVYPQGKKPNARYYDYRGRSNTFTIYVQEKFSLVDKLTIIANLQYQRHNYVLDDDKRFEVEFDRDYDFLSPRAGLIYKAAPDVNIFASASAGSRQPAFSDIYDAKDYWANPNYRSVNFEESSNGWNYIGPELKPEKLIDLELGTDFKRSSDNLIFSGEINLYWMQVKDELVPYAGQVDDMNLPISGNAEKTLHQGIEIAGNAIIQKQLVINGNLSLNDDHFVDYVEYGFDWDAWETITYDYSGNRIGGFPRMMANYRIGHIFGELELGLAGRYVGKQYIDNSETYELKAYHILNADMSFDIGKLIGFNSLKATMRLHNITNAEYEQAAYIEPDDGQPRYMVGAERNVFLSIRTEF